MKYPQNQTWLSDPANRNPDGSIKDGAECPICHQHRKGDSFFYKKENVYVSLCLNCRRTYSDWPT